MAQYGRRVRHPRMSPEMRRRLELERHKIQTESAEEETDESGGEADQGWNLMGFARREAPSPSDDTITTVMATVLTIVADNSSRTLGESTVTTLPATNPPPGYFTIPSESGAPVTASSLPESGDLSPPNASPSSVTPTPTYNSPHPTVSDHFFSHIPSSSPAIPSPSPSSFVFPPVPSPTSSASLSTATPVPLGSNSNASSGSTSPSSVSFPGAISSSFQSTTFLSTTVSSSTSAETARASASSTSGGGNGGQTSSGSGSQSQNSGSSGGVNTSSVVGGVVGGVAGAVILFLLVLFLLRWRKQYYARKTRGALPSGDGASGTAGPGSGPQNPEMMSQRSSLTPLAAAAASTGFFSRWRYSVQTVSTQDTTPSERGFQKISGRKIPSVLHSGGDGYGSDGEEEIVPGAAMSSTDLKPGHLSAAAPTIVETPAEGDEDVGPSGRYASPSIATRNTDRVEGIFIRPSPARSPVASSVNLPASCQSTPPLQATRAMSIPRRPDLIGRSHPSWDGSRGSRFTESID